MAKHPKVTVGFVSGALTVLAPAPQRGVHKYSNCRCKCGVEKEVRNDQLAQGLQTSCGCKFEARVKISKKMLARNAADLTEQGKAGAAARWGSDRGAARIEPGN